MAEPVCYREEATFANFDEAAYLDANPDLVKAIAAGSISSGYEHFSTVGHLEPRWLSFPERIQSAKRLKWQWMLDLLKPECIHESSESLINCLTSELALSSGIADTEAVSAHDYDPILADMLARNPEWKVLDAGAGLRNRYYPNVVNYEIVAYETTDVLGVGEHLPFRDNAFDLVISNAVLEHVVDPFRCADELMRVVAPGGKIWCSVPFLQPYHGYPHHYYNMTFQGLTNLFAKRCDVQLLNTHFYFRPVYVFQELLGKYAALLPAGPRAEFEDLRIGELLSLTPEDIASREWFTQFPEEWIPHYCSGNTVIATKTH